MNVSFGHMADVTPEILTLGFKINSAIYTYETHHKHKYTESLRIKE